MKKSDIATFLAVSAMLGGDTMPTRVERTPIKRYVPPGHVESKRGLKQFFIDGQEVWAINEKNAIRKAKK